MITQWFTKTVVIVVQTTFKAQISGKSIQNAKIMWLDKEEIFDNSLLVMLYPGLSFYVFEIDFFHCKTNNVSIFSGSQFKGTIFWS